MRRRKRPRRGGQCQKRRPRDHAQGGRQPQAVDAQAQCRPQVTGAGSAGHRGGRAVGEEHENAGSGGKDGGGDAEPGEGHQAEPADHRRVRQEEGGLGHQGEQGGDGPPQHLARRPGRPGW